MILSMVLEGLNDLEEALLPIVLFPLGCHRRGNFLGRLALVSCTMQAKTQGKYPPADPNTKVGLGGLRHLHKQLSPLWSLARS